jgi:hypothetical protein
MTSMSPTRQAILAMIESADDEALVPMLHFLKAQIQQQPVLKANSGRSILRHAGKWQGDDFDECLQAVYDSRSETQF